MKSKWHYRLPVKLAALVLLFTFLSAACLGLCGTLLCGEAGFYSEASPSFENSGLIWKEVRDSWNDVESILRNCAVDGELTLSAQEYLERMQKRFSAENSNLRVVLECDDANGLLSLESVLGIPERGALTQDYRLVRTDSYEIPVQGGIIGRWVNVQQTGLDHYYANYTSGEVDEAYYEMTDYGKMDTWYDIRAYYYLDTTLPVVDSFWEARRTFNELRGLAYPTLILLIGGLLLALLVWFYLMSAVGHRADADKGVITLRFIDRIPYDLFTGLCVVGIAGIAAFAVEWITFHWGVPLFWMMIAGCALGSEVLFTVFTLSTAVRWKSHTLLRNTIIWRVCAWFWRGLSSGAGKVSERLQSGREISPEEQAQKQEQRAQTFNKIGEGARSTAGLLGRALGAIGGWFRKLWDCLGRGFEILPVAWKGVLLLLGIGVVNVLLLLFAVNNYDGIIFLVLMLLFDMWVLWKYLNILRQMIWLHEGAKKIAAGDLDYRIPTDVMKWEFKAHGEALNTIRGGIDAAVEERVKAVEERIKSDRMRNELLTNVSHDIKTPLTSIINYVDLLKKEKVDGEKAQEYIEVLDRQSIRLKKLLEDLLEASKASTGNITVNAAPTNVGELLRQVAGEYAEKLATAKLEPIITLPGREAVIFADGRLLWRVFDNLMANIVKYAMPQTRVYLDLQSDASMTVVAVKNVSRERLNIAADELMERFVRGDASRATEGSGLGLSIAQSLTELMGGEFMLMIDGDLFKVQISFPTLDEPLPRPEPMVLSQPIVQVVTDIPSEVPTEAEPEPETPAPEPAEETEPVPEIPAPEPAEEAEPVPEMPAPEPAEEAEPVPQEVSTEQAESDPESAKENV